MTLIHITHVHNAGWVKFTESRCEFRRGRLDLRSAIETLLHRDGSKLYITLTP